MYFNMLRSFASELKDGEAVLEKIRAIQIDPAKTGVLGQLKAHSLGLQDSAKLPDPSQPLFPELRVELKPRPGTEQIRNN